MLKLQITLVTRYINWSRLLHCILQRLKVTFVAVNCWYESGFCRQHNSFPHFPIIFVYHTDLNGYRYHGRPTMTSGNLCHYRCAERPLHYSVCESFVGANHKAWLPKSTRSLFGSKTGFSIGIWRMSNLVIQSVVLGFFDFHGSPQPPGYAQFYFASLRINEHSNSVLFSYCLIGCFQIYSLRWTSLWWRVPRWLLGFKLTLQELACFERSTQLLWVIVFNYLLYWG